MANKNPNRENLIPFNKRTEKEQRIIASMGGKKSVEVRREKKLLSQLYADFLSKEHGIVLQGEKRKLSSQELINSIILKVLSRANSESVSMLKEIREATEGDKHSLTNTDGTPMVMPTQIIIRGVRGKKQ